MSEEVHAEVLQADEALAKVYRIGETFQVFLFVILSFGGIVGIYKVSKDVLDPVLITLISLFYVSVIFPIIVKVQNVWRYAIGLGLRLSTVGGIIYVSATVYKPSTVSGRAMFLVAVTVFVFELYQHLIGIYPRKKAILALIIGIAAMLFAIGSYLLFSEILSFIPTVILVTLLTIVFIRAIMPERKIRFFQ